MVSARFLVSGLVQGVFFRNSTEHCACDLGLVGHARNLDDDRVDVVASGTTQALAQLHAWLRQGPLTARIDGVERTDLPLQDHNGFTIR